MKVESANEVKRQQDDKSSLKTKVEICFRKGNYANQANDEL